MEATTATTLKQDVMTPPPAPCSCCQHEEFVYTGLQVFPLRVAQAAGFSTHRFQLWTCTCCLTTVAIPLLGDDE